MTERPSWLTPSVLAGIETAASGAYPREVAGIVVDAGDTLELVTEISAACAHFELSDRLLADIMRIELRGRQIRAFFHSHPDGVADLSTRDRAYMELAFRSGTLPAFPGADYLICALDRDGREHVVYRVSNDAPIVAEILRHRRVRWK